MSNLNLAVIEGRLTRNAELKYVGNVIVCNFSIACNYSKKNQNGEWSTIADFFDCAVFGAYAESMAPYLTKGRAVIVEARLRQDRWEKNGESRSKITLSCNTIRLLPQGKKSESNEPAEPDSAPDFDAEQPPEKIPF